MDLGCYKWYQSQTLGDSNEETEPRRGWTQGGVPARMLGPEGGWTQGGVPARTLGPEEGWIVRSHIGWGGERNIFYKGVETSHY